MSRYHVNFILITAFVLLWNSGFIGAEFGLHHTRTFTFVFYRYLALTIVLFLALVITKRFYRPEWRSLRLQMLIGVLAHGVWLSCVMIAINYGVPAGIVALVVALQPLATGALSGLAVGEPTSLSRWLGLLTGFAGVAAPVLSRVEFQLSYRVFAWLIPLGSVIAITTASLLQRRVSLATQGERIPVLLSLFYQSLATTVVFAVPAVFYEGLVIKWTTTLISSLVWLVIAVSLGAYALMWILIDRIDATRVASLFYMGPPVTMLMAWLAFGDQVQLIDITGLVLVLTGVVLTYMRIPTLKPE